MTLSEHLHTIVTAHVAAGELPGAAWWVSSMTKPVVAAAAMTLVDDGSLQLDTAIDELLPELADRRVLIDAAGSLTATVPARRPIRRAPGGPRSVGSALAAGRGRRTAGILRPGRRAMVAAAGLPGRR